MRKIQIKKLNVSRRASKRGVSLTEFLMTLIATLSLIYAVIWLGGSQAIGSYVQYATFMAARAYSVSAQDEGDRDARAVNTFRAYMKKSVIAGPPFLKPSDNYKDGGVLGFRLCAIGACEAPVDDWGGGVQFHFGVQYFPSFFGNFSGAYDMTSEAYLGSNPLVAEIQDFQQGGVLSPPPGYSGTPTLIFDNGF